ncbi:unnamed protein product [Caenorhabditis angaria]|uniref:Uncharacterized protein n=1 Tax=Caenorhabditis angaria TaxID=860376 RepID=A0A9P1IPZ0_9PELO|nr:unnamed protein product [Caenorhabditis angaria]
MENEQISMLEYAHLKKCISELERQADALQRDRLSGGIEEQRTISRENIEPNFTEQSDFQSTNPEVDIYRISQEIDDEKEDICIGIISDPFGQQNETSAQFVVSCGLEDVLGFDPFVESAKGLLDLMREESENFGGRSFGQRQNSSIFF